MNQHCGGCNCERRAIVFCQDLSDADYVPNIIECNNNFINETCYQICYPSSSIYFQQDPLMYENNEMSKPTKMDDCNDINGNIILNADEMFLTPIFLSCQKNLFYTDFKRLMHYYFISPQISSKGFQLSCINNQYSNFFEFFVNDKKNRANLNYNEINYSLLKWDGVEVNQNLMENQNDENQNLNNQNLNFNISRARDKLENCFINNNFRIYCFEHIDYGALLYRNCFLGNQHANILFHDQQYGPIIISIMTETITKLHRSSTVTKDMEKAYQKEHKRPNTSSVLCSTKPFHDLNSMDSSPSYLRHSIIVRATSMIPLRCTFYEGISQTLNKRVNLLNINHQSDIINYLFPKFEFANGIMIENSSNVKFLFLV